MESGPETEDWREAPRLAGPTREVAREEEMVPATGGREGREEEVRAELSYYQSVLLPELVRIQKIQKGLLNAMLDWIRARSYLDP